MQYAYAQNPHGHMLGTVRHVQDMHTDPGSFLLMFGSMNNLIIFVLLLLFIEINSWYGMILFYRKTSGFTGAPRLCASFNIVTKVENQEFNRLETVRRK